MKLGAGSIVIAVGLLILWLAVTGKLGNIEAAWQALTNSMSPEFQADLKKAEKATPKMALPPLGTDPGMQGAAMFNVPLPFPLLPSMN